MNYKNKWKTYEVSEITIFIVDEIYISLRFNFNLIIFQI